MNYFYLFAGGASAFALVLHILLGRARKPPALGDGADPWMRLDADYGRHGATLLLAAMTLGFADAARSGQGDDLGLALTLMALGLAALRASLAIRARAPKLDFPEWGLIALAGGLGAIGWNT